MLYKAGGLIIIEEVDTKVSGAAIEKRGSKSTTYHSKQNTNMLSVFPTANVLVKEVSWLRNLWI